MSSLHSQDLKTHQWKNRLMVIYSNSQDNALYQSQMEELKSDLNGLQDRKLIVYKIVDNQVNYGFDPNREWHTAAVFKSEYEPNNKNFEVQLIGLDGGLKLRKNEVLSLEKLFETIDQMPMRRSEIRKKNK